MSYITVKQGLLNLFEWQQQRRNFMELTNFDSLSKFSPNSMLWCIQCVSLENRFYTYIVQSRQLPILWRNCLHLYLVGRKTWRSHLSSLLCLLTYAWRYFELVYKPWNLSPFFSRLSSVLAVVSVCLRFCGSYHLYIWPLPPGVLDAFNLDEQLLYSI